MLDTLTRGRYFYPPRAAREFGVRTETIYRDVRKLRNLGYPILSKGSPPEVAYLFEPHWSENCPLIRLSLQQIEAILLAAEQYCRIGPPPKPAQMALAKLHALHCEAGPPSRVRIWRSVVGTSEAPTQPATINPDVVTLLSAGIDQERWCQLSYKAMTEPSPAPLIFAPYDLRGIILVGRARDIEPIEVLDVSRISSVSLLEEQFTRPTDTTPESEITAALERVQDQVMRIIGIARTLNTGKTPTRTELAQAYSTTLTTIRRDLDILENTGYSIRELRSASGSQMAKNEAFFGAVPSLPFDATECASLLHVLTRFAKHYLVDETLQAAISALKGIPDESLAILGLTSEVAGPESGESFWALFEAILDGKPRVVIYEAHWRLRRTITFQPQTFELYGHALRVRGLLQHNGETVSLQVGGIITVREVSPFSAGTDTRPRLTD